jgi:hypothetical protein
MTKEQYRLTKSEKARLDSLQADNGKDPASKRAAKHVTKNLFHEHRGAYGIQKRGVQFSGECIIFGNDGFTGVRVQKEVAKVVQQLEGLAIQVLGFSVEPDGYSWAMRVECDDEDLLHLIVWNAWFDITCTKVNPMKEKLNDYLDECGYAPA